MAYKKSDILFLGIDKHADTDGNLFVSITRSTADFIVLREVLTLFNASVTDTASGKVKGHYGQYETASKLLGCSTNLPFSALASLNECDSFPEVEKTRRDREEHEARMAIARKEQADRQREQERARVQEISKQFDERWEANYRQNSATTTTGE